MSQLAPAAGTIEGNGLFLKSSDADQETMVRAACVKVPNRIFSLHLRASRYNCSDLSRKESSPKSFCRFATENQFAQLSCGETCSPMNRVSCIPTRLTN